MLYAKEYRRKEILENNMIFKEGWIDLVYSNHAMERLKERLRGDVELYPKQINISKLNIYKGYSYGDRYLHKITVRLEYKKDEWIFMVILPGKGLVKSVWFSKKYDKETRARKKMAIFPDTLGQAPEGEKV